MRCGRRISTREHLKPAKPTRRAVVDYVGRTRASLVLGDAAEDERFAHEAYVAAARLKSVLCLPIVHQGEIGAILYLENDLARDAFSQQLIELIQILIAPGSISLAKARPCIAPTTCKRAIPKMAAWPGGMRAATSACRCSDRTAR
jgi:GAF domain-containing protein